MDFNQACTNYPSIILLIDPVSSKIVGANKKASQTYGYSIDKLCTMNISDINILNSEQIKQEMEIAKSENRNYFHSPHKTFDGTIIEMEVISFPTVINDQIILFSTIEPCENSSHFNMFDFKYFDNTRDSIIILDQSMRVINFNKKFGKIFNTSSKNIFGKKIIEITKTDEIKNITNFCNILNSGNVAEIDISFNNPDKNNKYFNILGFPTFFRDNFFGAVIFFRNKTEEAIKEINKTNPYKEALVKAEMYRNQKDQFFFRMSHNMKTPLTAIKAFSEFGQVEKDSTKLNNYFKQINQSADYLLRLVNDILTMNKIQSTSIKLTNKPLCKTTLLKNILDIVNVTAAEKNIKIITNFDEKMWPYHSFDIIRLQQIYLNILGNAIKYSHENSTIVWNKYYLKDANGNHYFRNEIIDKGVGMSKEFVDIMFESYAQEPNDLSPITEGSGLGLTITKNVIDLLDGRIWCDSELNNGTTMYFEIPANEISEEEYLNYKTIKENSKKLEDKKVLICEDNPINIKIIEKILNSFGLVTEIAPNGLIGVEKVKKNSYFAVIMDIQMPVMDGIESAKAIRKFNTKIPIIALSANSDKIDIKNCKAAGMNEHIAKPIDQQSLFSTLLKFV